MPTLKFTATLKRFFPKLKAEQFSSATILELLNQAEEHYPGLLFYILDEQKMLRKHVNIFIDGNLLADRNDLNKVVGESSEVYIIQALSGG